MDLYLKTQCCSKMTKIIILLFITIYKQYNFIISQNLNVFRFLSIRSFRALSMRQWALSKYALFGASATFGLLSKPDTKSTCRRSSHGIDILTQFKYISSNIPTQIYQLKYASSNIPTQIYQLKHISLKIQLKKLILSIDCTIL